MKISSFSSFVTSGVFLMSCYLLGAPQQTASVEQMPSKFVTFEVILPSGPPATVTVGDGQMAKIGINEQMFGITPFIHDSNEGNVTITLSRLTLDKAGFELPEFLEEFQTILGERITLTQTDPILKLALKKAWDSRSTK